MFLMRRSRCVVLKSRPNPNVDLGNFEMENRNLRPMEQGEFLVKVEYLSIDPAIRTWINTAASYTDAVPIGGVVRSQGLGRVLESKNDKYSVGDIIVGWFGWQEYSISNGQDVYRVKEGKFPISYNLGILGLAGFSAWWGLNKIGMPKEGETVLVSSAAGSVGSAAGQLFKRLGCKVVGTVGSQEKADLCLSKYQYDVVINYKNTDAPIDEKIKQACPNGIDVYFDNVGGVTLDAVMKNINTFGRVILCGTISLPITAAPPQGPRVERTLLIKRAKMEGFVILDHMDWYEHAYSEMFEWVNNGSLVSKEDIFVGLEKAAEGLVRLLAGQNLGKQLIKI
jgi:NADPH-dependent curcumin reductase